MNSVADLAFEKLCSLTTGLASSPTVRLDNCAGSLLEWVAEPRYEVRRNAFRMHTRQLDDAVRPGHNS